MEIEVQRLMMLPQEKIDEMMQQELAFTQPTSKAASLRQQRTMESSGEVPAMPKSVAMKPPPPRRSMFHLSEGAAPEGHLVVEKAAAPTPGQCEHRNITRRGRNAYISMETCKDCGKILKKEPKSTTATDRTMTTANPGECEHPSSMVSWRGTNGYAWKWSCEKCGMSETHKKEPGMLKPVPGHPP